MMFSKIPALKIPEIRAAALVADGWHLIYDEGTSNVVAVQSIIPEWETMPWAMQTYYRGKYRFNESGVLEIKFKSSFSGRIDNAVPKSPPDKIVLPPRAVHGSDRRLRDIFEESVIEVGPVGYDYSARLHYGPDGSAILVTDPFWGIPIPDDRDYIEPHQDYQCLWDGSTPNTWFGEAPWWAMPDV